MRTYVIASSIFFDLLAVAQLIRFLLGWPLVVNGFEIPVWPSAVAFVVLTAFSIWGIRLFIRDSKAQAPAQIH
jgi:hypothetical protein